MGNPTNPFSDFDEEFQKTEKAVNSTPGRVPEATYKFVCTTAEIKKGDETVVADHDFFVANSGTKGFKIFCEILEPESVPNPKTGEPHITKGQVLEHVFYGTVKNLPFIKRDLSTIIARDFLPDEKVSEVMANHQWAGCTFEGVVRDETYNGRVSSRIAFINPWQPEVEDKKTDDKKVDEKKADPKKTEKAATAKPTGGAAKTASAKGGSSDF
jgi:hypothetical protein